MPFGLRNAPATFQRLMHMVLAEVKKNCEVYLDDVEAYSDTRSEHIKTLVVIFGRVKGGQLHPELCSASS